MSAAKPSSPLDKINPKIRRDIDRFVEANRYVQQPDELAHMKFVADAMELVSTTKLSGTEKKAAVVAMYNGLAQADTNGFKLDFNIAGAVEFIWNATTGQFGIKVEHAGCCAKFLPCCADVSLSVGPQGVGIGITPLPDPPAPAAAAPAVVVTPPAGSAPVASAPVPSTTFAPAPVVSAPAPSTAPAAALAVTPGL